MSQPFVKMASLLRVGGVRSPSVGCICRYLHLVSRKEEDLWEEKCRLLEKTMDKLLQEKEKEEKCRLLEKTMDKLLQEKEKEEKCRLLEKTMDKLLQEEEQVEKLQTSFTYELAKILGGHRVILDSALRTAYPSTRHLSQQYDKFLKKRMLAEPEVLSPEAQEVLHRIPQAYRASENDLLKELKGQFVQSVPLPRLARWSRALLWGDPVRLTAMAVLVGLLQTDCR